MFFNLIKKSITKEEIAKLLKTNTKALEEFETFYSTNILSQESENFFEKNSRQVNRDKNYIESTNINDIEELIDKIVDELLTLTNVYKYKKNIEEKNCAKGLFDRELVSFEDICKFPKELRPQLTGNLLKRDLGDTPSYIALLDIYKKMKETKNPNQQKQLYHCFRQGLDILDLDNILYEMLGTNPNSMGYWLPKIVNVIKTQNFFKIPETTIIKVPMSLLQLTRCEYNELTTTTLEIINRFCKKVFSLEEDKEYFIKTGTYSSKFDFRNAYVHGAKEVRELGEYLTFIQFQANQMASPLTSPCIYGVSTTNEWVVREFIKDKENNPCIYKGLPLHTEYRVFVDFDTNKVIGINPYWDPKVMKQRFGHEDDANSPHQIHDYIIYCAHEEKLMQRYNENKDKIIKNLEMIIPDVDLVGQWSIDIMQNGEDFWIIDMALAQNSALIECVPIELRKSIEENWLPNLSKIN